VTTRTSQSKGKAQPGSPEASSLQPPASLRSAQEGFALIITITLLAFLLLVMVGLATFTKVETSVSDNALKQTQAKQNALMALNIALGQLQKHAGPDTRVTATADFVPGATNLHYTGVWDSTTATAAPLTWLVSGNETGNLLATTPTNAAATVTVVDTNTVGTALASDKVTAPLVPIKANGVPGQPDGTKIGNYAWWVGDQGVKATLNFTEDNTSLTFLTADERNVLRQMQPERQTGEALFTTLQGNDATVQAAMNRVQGFGQYALVNGITAATLPPHFHSLTSGSWGVLASTASSATAGLKQDLSVDATLLPGSGFANVANLTRALVAPNTNRPLTRTYKITPAQTTAAGKVIDGVAPVLTEFSIQFAIYTTAATSRSLTLKVLSLYELWNPYTSELVGEDLELAISGLPSVTVTCKTNSTGNVTGTATVNLQTASPLVIRLPFPNPADQLFRFLPGRVLNWAGTVNSIALYNSRSSNLATTQTVTNGFATLSGTPVGTSTLSYSAPATTLTIVLRRASDHATLATYHSPAFNSLSGSITPITSATPNFAYPFRLVDRVDYVLPPATSPGQWLVDQDPRDLNLPQSAMLSANLQPGSYSNQYGITNTSSLLNRAASTSAGALSISYAQDVPVFELPRQPYTSVGSLQHLQIGGARPFVIGNSWGSAGGYNKYFDQFYFSGATLPAQPDPPVKLPNVRLRAYNSATGGQPTLAQVRAVNKARSSRYYLVDGVFNFNSLSPEAWQAILGGISLPTWTYVNLSASDGAQDPATTTATLTPLTNAFFRLAQSGKETYQTLNPLPASVTPAEKQFYRPGVRQLTNAERASLATEIVNRVKAKLVNSGPFKTVEQFLAPSNRPEFGGSGDLYSGKSLLEAAIAAVPTINAPGGVAIDQIASSFLMQGDIMTALAPVVAPRSDTFVVRAYGETLNPATGAVEGKAWCEALVQRVPEFADSSAGQEPEVDFSALNATNRLFGRKFKIISLRWLNSSEI
jgi:Tfp pilus assembly protein PilX